MIMKEKDFTIATASTCDLDKDWLDRHRVPMISYTFEIEGKIYIDDCRRDTRHQTYQAMREDKLPNTSQITEYNYYVFFEDIIKSGSDIIFADMSRAVSGSYFNSLRAADQIREDYPDAKITILDTRCITTGLGYLVRRMVYMQESGSSYDEIVQWAEENERKIVHRFMVDDLKWLRRGGRLSNASAIVGSLLSIKPLICLAADGSLVAYDKIRGRKKAIRALLESTDTDNAACPITEIILSHSDCLEEGRQWMAAVKEKYPHAKVTLQELGPVIGSHIGPGFLSIVYLSDTRRA